MLDFDVLGVLRVPPYLIAPRKLPISSRSLKYLQTFVILCIMYEVADVPKSFTPNLRIYESSLYQINWIQEDRINLVLYIVELRVAHISKSFSPNV